MGTQTEIRNDTDLEVGFNSTDDTSSDLLSHISEKDESEDNFYKVADEGATKAIDHGD